VEVFSWVYNEWSAGTEARLNVDVHDLLVRMRELGALEKVFLHGWKIPNDYRVGALTEASRILNVDREGKHVDIVLEFRTM
jgi:hypothetical protein